MSYAQRIAEIVRILIAIGCLALVTLMYPRHAVYSFNFALITTGGAYLWARSTILEPRLSNANFRPAMRNAILVMSFAMIGASLGTVVYFGMNFLLSALEPL